MPKKSAPKRPMKPAPKLQKPGAIPLAEKSGEKPESAGHSAVSVPVTQPLPVENKSLPLPVKPVPPAKSDVGKHPVGQGTIARANTNVSLTPHGATLKPVGEGLHLLVEPEAIQIRNMLRDTPWLISAALRLHPNPIDAFGFLLANETHLNIDDYTLLLKTLNLHTSGNNGQFQRIEFFEEISTGNRCPAGWFPYGSDQCIFLGNSINPQSSILERDAAADLYDAILTREQIQIYLTNRGEVSNLFLMPARLLNNPTLTNMSDEALAALVFSQVYVEEKWHKGLGWLHPFYNSGDDPSPLAQTSLMPELGWLGNFFATVNDKRYGASLAPTYAAYGDVESAVLSVIPARDNIREFFEGIVVPELIRGVGYGLGNQPYAMTEESAFWYLNYAQHNGLANTINNLPTNFFSDLGQFSNVNVARATLIAELGDYGLSPLSEISPNDLAIGNVNFDQVGEASQFWNVMRFLFTGASLREGTSYPTGQFNYATLGNLSPENPAGQPGRPIYEVSAFSIMSSVYSGSLDFQTFSSTEWNSITASERNKAIATIERLGSSSPENFRIVGPDGIAVDPLVSAYHIPGVDTPEELAQGVQSGQIVPGRDYDFLPYSREEAHLLMEALVRDINDENSDTRYRLIYDTQNAHLYAPLLRGAYAFYFGDSALAAIDAQIAVLITQSPREE